MVVKTKQISVISVVSLKSMVVKKERFRSYPWLVQKVWWLTKTDFGDIGG